jgi:hypothetical protein
MEYWKPERAVPASENGAHGQFGAASAEAAFFHLPPGVVEGRGGGLGRCLSTRAP